MVLPLYKTSNQSGADTTRDQSRADTGAHTVTHTFKLIQIGTDTTKYIQTRDDTNKYNLG